MQQTASGAFLSAIEEAVSLFTVWKKDGRM